MSGTERYPACAFLFDSSVDGLTDPPLQFFVGAVLAALGVADPTGRTLSRFMTGLPMLHSLATRTTAVHAAVRSSGHTESHDLGTYKYVVWEWLDSLTLTWSTVNPDKGSEIFRLHTGECVALVALDPAIRAQIDAMLRMTPGYAGAFEIDPGNPLHRVGFIEKLSYSAAIVDGAVVQERTFEGDEDWALEGADRFEPGGLRWESMGWLLADGPPSLSKVALSDRGAQTTQGYLHKHKDTVEGRVLRAIERAYWLNPAHQTFQFSIASEEADILEAVMPDGKFTSYLFNREHKQGGSKSTFFIDVLGIEPEDWRYLAAQLYHGLLNAEPHKLEFREWDAGYGMRYNVDIRVRGRDGRSGVVCTGWMMKPGSLPSLSSAMPGDRDANLPEAIDPPILPPGVPGDTEWEQLWTWANAAGIEAADTCVPTPMYLVGGNVISEGECGSASVQVRDARRGFAEWLSRSGTGETDGYGDVIMFAPVANQSRDRAVAWAKDVIVTLKLNGIAADFETFDFT